MIRRSKPWSKLQRRLYNIISDDIDLQIHCVVYPMNSNYGSTGLPRYFITLDKEIIWDYPADFVKAGNHTEMDYEYPYNTEVSEISDLIEEYINTPGKDLTDMVFENDRWGLTDILKASDRRVGKRRLEVLKRSLKSEAANIIINKRYNSLL